VVTIVINVKPPIAVPAMRLIVWKRIWWTSSFLSHLSSYMCFLEYFLWVWDNAHFNFYELRFDGVSDFSSCVNHCCLCCTEVVHSLALSFS
jgi:hypothetical protein